MNKIMLCLMVALTITGSAYAAESAKPEAKCYTNKEFMKYIDDNHLVTLYAGETTTGKTQEILLSNDRRSVTVEYIKPKEGATASDQYCVISVIHDVTFNDSAIEFLSKLLDKVRGQKV